MRKETFETPGLVRIKVENRSGSVQVLASEAGESQVTEVEIYSERDYPELESSTTVIARPFPGGTEVEVNVPQARKLLGLRNESMTVSIRAPRGAELDIKTVSADVEAAGSFGLTSVETVSGDVSVDEAREARLRSVSGDLAVGSVESEMRLKSVSGDIAAGRAGGPAEVSTTSGDAKLGDLQGPVSVDTVSGDLRVERVGTDATLRTVSGEVVVTWTDGDVQVRTVSGDVLIGVAPGHGLRVEAQSKSGEVLSEIGLSDGPQAPLRGEEEAAAAEAPAGADIELSIHTLSGDIRIVRAREEGAPTGRDSWSRGRDR